jgi:hypothetical protein
MNIPERCALPNIIWTLDIDNTQHVVRLVHGWFSGKREIWLDNNLIERRHKFIDYGSRQFFNIQDIDYELDIVLTGISYTYFLLRDEYPILTDQDKRKGRTAEDLLNNRFLRDQVFWHDLVQLLDLAFRSNREAAWASRNRLIGFLNGYLTIIQKSELPNPQRAGWSVLVRHASLFASDSGTKMRSDQRINSLLGNLKRSKDVFLSDSDYSWLFLPVIKKETPAELAARVRAFIGVVSDHAQRLPEDMCENKECHQRFTKDRQLIFINGMPRLFCPECKSTIPDWGKKAEKEYKEAPKNLLKGVIAGLGAAIIGAFVWAAIGVLLHKIMAVVSALILVGTVRAMDKVGVKRSGITMFISVLLTFFSVTLGNLTAIFSVKLLHGLPLSVQTLVESWKSMIARPSDLYVGYIMTLVWAGIIFISMWNQQKAYLSRVFKPHVEVIPGKY